MEAQPSGWDEQVSVVPAFHGLINGLLVEFGFGIFGWAVYLAWPRLFQPVMAFAQHFSAAAVGAL